MFVNLWDSNEERRVRLSLVLCAVKGSWSIFFLNSDGTILPPAQCSQTSILLEWLNEHQRRSYIALICNVSAHAVEASSSIIPVLACIKPPPNKLMQENVIIVCMSAKAFWLEVKKKHKAGKQGHVVPLPPPLYHSLQTEQQLCFPRKMDCCSREERSEKHQGVVNLLLACLHVSASNGR